jgi:ADP-ribose pyrophosphatase
VDLTEKRLSSERKYTGIIVNVDVDQALSPSGRQVKREVVRHPGGVGIVPLDEEGKLVLVRQYRYAFQQVLLEIPAGKNEPGQDAVTGAARELKEEIGAQGTLVPLGSLLASPGIFTEELNLFLGLDLTFGETHPDPDEFLEIVHLSFEEAEEMILSGQIRDSKTVAGILKAKLYLERQGKL